MFNAFKMGITNYFLAVIASQIIISQGECVSAGSMERTKELLIVERGGSNSIERVGFKEEEGGEFLRVCGPLNSLPTYRPLSQPLWPSANWRTLPPVEGVLKNYSFPL